jgi:hypothetical protein
MTAAEWDALEGAIGKLTPGEKLELVERVVRSLRTDDRATSAAPQHEALRALRQKLAALPIHNPDDGFSNRDHDSVLYGGS